MVGEDEIVVVFVSVQVVNCYGLYVVCVNVEDDLYNCMCFVVIGNYEMELSGCDQILLILLVLNEVGVVYKLLVLLVENGVLMCCFELCLVCSGVWEYYFYVDVEGYQCDLQVVCVLEKLCYDVVYFKVLGFYFLVY